MILLFDSYCRRNFQKENTAIDSLSTGNFIYVFGINIHMEQENLDYLLIFLILILF